MKKYRVTVNGNTYDVSVEELDSKEPTLASAQVSPAPVREKREEAPVQKQKPVINENDIKILSPMPGTILDIRVKEGDKVEKNQGVVLLEAMKMENEIVASEAGIVSKINISKGASVASGEVLITLR